MKIPKSGRHPFTSCIWNAWFMNSAPSICSCIHPSLHWIIFPSMMASCLYPIVSNIIWWINISTPFSIPSHFWPWVPGSLIPKSQPSYFGWREHHYPLTTICIVNPLVYRRMLVNKPLSFIFSCNPPVTQSCDISFLLVGTPSIAALPLILPFGED